MFAVAANAQQGRSTTPLEIPATVQQAEQKTAEPQKRSTVESDESKKRTVETKQKTDKPQSGGSLIKGIVVSFTDMVKGGDGRISKGEAFDMVKRGQPIGFLVGSKFYLVFNQQGKYDGKNLANFASVSAVGIIGTRTTKNGLNIIKAQKIRSME
jgi:hypothetical protein